MNTKLNPVERKAHTWCGPYALALISGNTYDHTYSECIRVANNRINYLNRDRMPFQKLRKVKVITGMLNHELERVAKALGCSMKWTFCNSTPTLSRMTEELRPNRIYVINITDHYVVVDTRNWTVCDNQTQEWEPIKQSKHRRKRVRNIAEVTGHKL